MKRCRKLSEGFTLVEVLIAMSIFTLAAVISSNILVDVVQLEKKSSIQNAIYEDVRIIMQQLTNEIQAGTIDYEEYYSMNVIQAANDPDLFYGINYGVYSSRFYNPGKSQFGATVNPDDLGIECSFPQPLPDNTDCEIFYTHSTDLNTGQNPFKFPGNDPDVSDAFCDNGTGNCGADRNIADELYLIDSTGTRKTIIGKKRISANDFAIGIVRMNGADLDQNGVVDVFGCSEEFDCITDANTLGVLIKYPFIQDFIGEKGIAAWTKYIQENHISVPEKSDLEKLFVINDTDFLPISPMHATIKGLKFIINPIEDPYKAYAEKAMQRHPSVTIILTMGLSKETLKDYPGTFADFTVQTTVAAGVIGKIDSYPPVNDLLRNNVDDSWIKGLVLPP